MSLILFAKKLTSSATKWQSSKFHQILKPGLQTHETIRLPYSWCIDKYKYYFICLYWMINKGLMYVRKD